MSLALIVRRFCERSLAVGAALALIAIVTFGGALRAASEVEAPLAATADALWASNFKDLAGVLQPLAQFKGRVTVVYFWATWCEPCQKEGPALQALYDKFKDKNFVVVGIAIDNADKVRDFVKKYGMAFPVVYGGTDAIKLSKDLGNSLGGIPFAVVIDRDGKIVERITGETKDGTLEEFTTPLLAN